jgi:hypothetical protein
MKKLSIYACLIFAVFWPVTSSAQDIVPNLAGVYYLLLDDSPTYHSINVHTSGLAGSGFSLLLNDKYELPITADGTVSFPEKLQNLSRYQVSINNPPSDVKQACWINGGTGTITSTNVDVTISCMTLGYTVGGTVNGLVGTGLTLALEDLTNGGIQQRVINANGGFILGALKDGTSYNISILSQPTNL